ncbi:hypothetical protein ACFP81_02510 [Deinococcus lacus]|uniref:Thioredoxin domain-containing protein n=1 Tax=Deinococcus lacus TaxID=392561 RepID=A0ABW1YBZ7_9DEIO
MRAVLESGAEVALTAFGVTEHGNFADPHRPDAGRRSVLWQPYQAMHGEAGTGELARDLGLSPTEVSERLEQARQALLAARSTRPQPGTDHKILTSWNGLTLAALADAARILDDAHWLERARELAGFLRATMRGPQGRMLHSFQGVARVSGLLEDHVHTALGLVALFQARGDLADLLWARELWDIIRQDFWDEEAGQFWATGGDAETLVARQAHAFDSAILSDNAAGAQLALWMHRYFADEAALGVAQRTISTFAAEMQATPHGLGGLWWAQAFASAPLQELAVLGTPTERRSLEREAAQHFLPFVALSPVTAGTALPAAAERPGGAAYVCVNHACRLPAASPEALREQLALAGLLPQTLS